MGGGETRQGDCVTTTAMGLSLIVGTVSKDGLIDWRRLSIRNCTRDDTKVWIIRIKRTLAYGLIAETME